MTESPFTMMLAAILSYKLLDLGISFVFKKITKDDYVTEKRCEQCKVEHARGLELLIEKRSEENRRMDEFKREQRRDIGLIRGVVLVIAAKMNIPVGEYKELVQ